MSHQCSLNQEQRHKSVTILFLKATEIKQRINLKQEKVLPLKKLSSQFCGRRRLHTTIQLLLKLQKIIIMRVGLGQGQFHRQTHRTAVPNSSVSLHIYLVSFGGYIVPCSNTNVGLSLVSDYTGDYEFRCEDVIFSTFIVKLNNT